MRLAVLLLGVVTMTALNPAALAMQANQSGERAFQRCYSCHSVNKGDKGLSGPNLDRLIGRPVAADPDFSYSKAFKDFAKRNPRWTKSLLNRFLVNSAAVVPGNDMGFFGLKDAKERTAIIGYLAADK